jgi:hypothetical protein
MRLLLRKGGGSYTDRKKKKNEVIPNKVKNALHKLRTARKTNFRTCNLRRYQFAIRDIS